MASQFVSESGDASFQKDVLESGTPVLVDFWATWCAPCLALAPVVEDLAKTYQGKLKVVKFNIENDTATPQRYGITSIPTLLFFKGGKVVQSVIGNQSKAKLDQIVQKVLS
jgi:thioredoxin 1